MRKDSFAVFVSLIEGQNIAFLLYLATSSMLRSQGYGSKILGWITENIPKTIVLTIEEVDEKYANYSQKVRRKAFYLKNGFHDANLKIRERGDIYQVLFYGEKLSPQEYQQLMKKISYGFVRTGQY